MRWVVIGVVGLFALFYLIARPHVGTVWYETRIDTGSSLADQPEVAGPYSSIEDCQQKENTDQDIANQATIAGAAQEEKTSPPPVFDCVSHTRLLWGW